MRTWLPNSKKCSALETALLALLCLAPLTALAAPAPAKPTLEAQLKTDFQKQRGASFEKLLKNWETRHGVQAVPSLVSIASDAKNAENLRYVALMGAAKLGGSDTAPSLTPFLKDKSWMIRSGALRALRTLKNPETGAALLPLLKDGALVVRAEAVDAIVDLKPNGAAEALVSTIEQSQNYQNGKAQSVPRKALVALAALQAKSVVPRLKPLLQHHQDPELQLQAIRTLETLTGKSLAKGLSLKEQTQAWDKELSKK